MYTVNILSTFDLWPTNLNTSRDQLLIKDYCIYFPSLNFLYVT